MTKIQFPAMAALAPTAQPTWRCQTALATLVLAAAFCGASAHAADLLVGGVRVSQSVAVAGASLQLNGAGIRYKGPFKVYTAALYTTKKVSTAEEFHAAPGSIRIVLTMLREVDSSELGNLFIRGIQNNAPARSLAKVLGDLPRIGEMFAATKKLLPGDEVMMDWIPGTGLVITVKGVAQGEPFRAPEFFTAMMDIWLGNAPADWQLKDALLGKSGTPAQS